MSGSSTPTLTCPICQRWIKAPRGWEGWVKYTRADAIVQCTQSMSSHLASDKWQHGLPESEADQLQDQEMLELINLALRSEMGMPLPTQGTDLQVVRELAVNHLQNRLMDEESSWQNWHGAAASQGPQGAQWPQGQPPSQPQGPPLQWPQGQGPRGHCSQRGSTQPKAAFHADVNDEIPCATKYL